MIKIEKNIPSPDSRTATRYPLAEMEPGDSFFVQAKTEREKVIIRTAITRAKQRSKAVGTFITRSVDGGIRVWRIA
jgi:hypothetical protein